jgi:predicted acetyltransferase
LEFKILLNGFEELGLQVDFLIFELSDKDIIVDQFIAITKNAQEGVLQIIFSGCLAAADVNIIIIQVHDIL